MPKGAEPELLDKWKIADAAETYGIRNWGKGYFSINKTGHVTVQPTKRPDESIDLKELVAQ
jgi:arginine decarboxylase